MILSTPENFSNIEFILKIINTNISSSVKDIVNKDVSIQLNDSMSNIYLLPNNRAAKFLNYKVQACCFGRKPLILSAQEIFHFNSSQCESIVFKIMRSHQIYGQFAPHKILEFAQKIAKYIERLTLNNFSKKELDSLFFCDVFDQSCCCDVLQICYDDLEMQELIKSSLFYYESIIRTYFNNNIIMIGVTELNAFLIKLIKAHEACNRLLLIFNENLDSASYKLNDNILHRLDVSRETIIYSCKPLSYPITYVEFSDSSQEAFYISLFVKGISSEENVLIVSPNQVLSKKIKNYLQKFGVLVDDSIGDSFSKTTNGMWSFFILNLMKNNFNIYSFINLFKQDDDFREDAVLFEVYVRKARPTAKNILQALGLFKKDHTNVSFESVLLSILDIAQNCHAEQMLFSEYMNIYFSILNLLKASAYLDNKIFFEAHQHIYKNIENISMEDFYVFVTKCILGNKTHISTKSNVILLGPIEAQLVEADYIIVTSADENNWTSSFSQFLLTQQLAKEYYLPLKEQQDLFLQSIFEKLISKQNVIVTRAINKSEPSQIYKSLSFIKPNKDHFILNVMNDITSYLLQNTAVLLRQGNIPDLILRPRYVSVSDVLSLRKNPYVFYAKKILHLSEMQKLSSQNTTIKGIYIHKVLDSFVKNKQYSFKSLLDLSEEILRKMDLSIEDLGIWYFSIKNILQYAFNTFDFNQNYIVSEIRRAKTLQINENQMVTIECVADRIDIDKQNNNLSIIDYKTGNVVSKKSLYEELPQLPLEGFIYSEYTHHNVTTKINNLSCIQLKNNSLITHEINMPQNCDKIIEQAVRAAKKLLDEYLFQLKSFDFLPEDYDNQYTLLSRAKELGLDNA